MENILTVENLSKIISTDDEIIEVLEKVSFTLEKSSFTTIVGPSGSGKSTLLRIISGLTDKTHGNVSWKDKNPKLSFVFQSFALFPYMTVAENIGFGLKMKGVKKSRIEATVKQLINEVGLSGFENEHPQELSGGMRQRVGIARALSLEPDVLLLDEPFSALDEFTAENLRQLLLKIWKERKMTVLMVTHLISEALQMADKIIVVSKRPGTVKKIIDCNLERPIGTSNFLRNNRTKPFFELEDQIKSLIDR